MSNLNFNVSNILDLILIILIVPGYFILGSLRLVPLPSESNLVLNNFIKVFSLIALLYIIPYVIIKNRREQDPNNAYLNKKF